MAPSSRSIRASGRGRGGGGGRGDGNNSTTTTKRRKLIVDLSSSSGKRGGRLKDLYGDDDVTPPKILNDEDVESEDDDDDFDSGNDDDSEDDDDEEEEETVDDKRLRLAREYLDKMEATRESDEENDDDDGETDDDDSADDIVGDDRIDGLGKRMAKERLRRSGLLDLHVADSVATGILASRISIAASNAEEDDAKSWIDAGRVTYHRGHDLTPTCVSLSKDGRVAFSGSKDGSLLMWDIETGKKTLLLPASLRGDNGNRREILTIATSDDGRYLAVGGRDDKVRIFDVRKTSSSSTSSSYPIVATFEGHKKAVTALAFRPRTLDLYSGSDDRCIRRYDLNSMTYVETLYGHQSPVVDVSCASKNRPVTVARDRTVRVWKVEEDSHLVYRPGGDVGGAECVSSMRDGWFATGHDDGRLALWKEEKKRPVGSVVAAHGRIGSANNASCVTRSIMCCDALALSDVLATGSNDGYLRFWRVIADEREFGKSGIKPLDVIPIHGFINGIAMGPGGKFCVAAIGQEPRMGRWDRVPRAKNRFAIIHLHGA